MTAFLDTLQWTFGRLRLHRVLVMWVLAGLVTATTLAMGLSVYIDTVYTGLLDERLNEPPYALRWRYLGAWNGNITPDDIARTNSALDAVQASMRLPTVREVNFTRGGTWSARIDGGASLGTLGIGVLTGADDQIHITAGQWPPARAALEADEIPVLLPQTVFYTMGVQVGDRLQAQAQGSTTVINLRVVALWRPVDANDPAWIFPPRYFDSVILVQADDFGAFINGRANPIDESAWLVSFDGATVRTSDVPALIGRITDALRVIEAALPGVRVELSPLDALNAFNNEVNLLTGQLVIIVAPVGGLVLYFVAMVAGLLVQRQAPDDVKLRSRGMSRLRLLTVHVLMWLILAAGALVIGVLLSPSLVGLVARTTSFLRFDSPNTLENIALMPQAIAIGALTGLIAASSGLILAWRTTAQNINNYRRAALSGRAWWQRAYLDLLLVAAATYTLFALSNRGGLTVGSETPFSDPLTFTAPTLFALGLALLVLRVLPFSLRVLAGVVGLTKSVALLMALRELTRATARYRGTLLMTVFTLSLTGFTASMASTLDRSLMDTINYRIGADMVVISVVDAQAELSEDGSSYSLTGYNAPPVLSILEVEGVEAVSRIGRHSGVLRAGNQAINGTILGVDRAALAPVTRFREDFADEPLNALLNKLAGNRTGILLSRRTAEQYNLVVGQTVTIGMQGLNSFYETRVQIIDLIDYFPTLNPTDGFFAITSIDPLHELVGTPLPYDAWLDLAPDADPNAIEAALRAQGYPVQRTENPLASLDAARAEPARRGVLGFLSVGFVAAIILTLIAAVVQSTASLRAQSQQLGALRAMGMGGLSVSSYVLAVQGIASVSGIAGGTGIGMLTTLLFLPLLDFSGGLPPYLVRVSWDEIALVYLIFAGVLFAVAIAMTWVLSREQVATVVRLGE